MQTNAAGSSVEIDPITFEVVRHRLSAITEEQAITLQAVSGSPVVTDATDFNVGTYLADGSIVTMGPQVLFHSGSMASVVRNIVKDFSENPGIREGDMFVLNDPYRGALHQPDVSVVAPVFHEGVHVAWVGCCAHQLDIGGMNFGSWSIKARDIQQEAMLLPGVKLVEGGLIREDLWQMIMGMTRLPMAVGLDLKAMIAANTVAGRRLVELCDRYGVDRVLRVMEMEIDHSEEQLRDRLRTLPDGTFRAIDYLEHDGHENRLYEYHLALTKSGDELIFDFAGTSPQAPGFINATYSGLVGGVFTAVLPILGSGLRWNEGLLRPLTIRAPKGSVVNANWPAPVSSATIGSIWVVTNVSVAALSRLAVVSAESASDATAVTKGSMTALVLSGSNRDGQPYGNFFLDSTAGGGGAYHDHDGLNASGDFCVPRPAITNVESHEATGPVLYLYRALIADSGGPGRQRGGATVGLAFTPHDVDSLETMIVGHGVEVPNSVGLFGGYEGSCNRNEVLKRVDGLSPVGRVTTFAEHDGWQGERVSLGAKPGFFTLNRGDVLAYSFQGGGGFGDPIDRDPKDVAADVVDGYVSVGHAEDVYGVVVDRSGAIDASATTARRSAIRAARIGRVPAATASDEPVPGTRTLTPSLLLSDDGDVVCRCRHSFGPGFDWTARAVRRTVEPEAHGPYVRLHAELELREFVCPSCGTLLGCEVARIGAPDLTTVELR
ncbi:hydantoinase B/oxoprolinase family protein [Amycolatopsis sp. GM8]|uniref:hydantoinase B/oxoprolinase family protein n=1 Tax=Amycolatopsis sp. GM8 TaxID=2896530 RepID=UPI001F031390|nr:hydantoinase B/oxoprolinase family protein [Amycolatopsis sp. GM8]